MQLTVKSTVKSAVLVAALAGMTSMAVAKDITITVWAGGSNEHDQYRLDAIEMAADILERESKIEGKTLNITVKKKRDFGGWSEFRQAVNLGAESGKVPDILVAGHNDIAPWSKAGYIVPAEDYLDFDTWPLNNLYDGMLKAGQFNGVQWGVAQDAESRPFFLWKPHYRKIGYSDAEIDAIPGKIKAGTYTMRDVMKDAKKAVDMGVVEKGYGFYPRPSKGDTEMWYQAFGGTLQDPKSGKLVFHKKAMTDYFQYWADLVKAGVTKKNHIGTDWAQWYKEVSTGKAFAWYGGTWHYPRYKKYGNFTTDQFFDTIGFGLIPAGGNGMGRPNTVMGPLMYLISNQKDDSREEIAAKLIAIATEPRINNLHAIKSGHLAVTKEQANIPFYANDRWASEATEQLLANANAKPNHAGWGIFSDAIWNGIEAAWTGSKSPQDAVAAMEKELKAKLGNQVLYK